MNIFKQFIEHKKELRKQYYDECYHNLVGNKKKMINNKCYGINGGDKYTNYLHYACIECPYFEKNKKF